MKISFEGKTIHDILEDMQSVLAAYPKAPGPVPKANVSKASVPVDKPVDKPVGKPAVKVSLPEDAAPLTETTAALLGEVVRHDLNLSADTPVDIPAPKPKIDRVAAMNKARAAKVAKRNAPPPEDTPSLFDEPKAPAVDPAEVVKIRQKTIEDLQSAYANGHQAEVFELLSRFGNGAKSFRELPPEAFMPISEAIAKGALT